MSQDHLTPEARRENALALAATLGIHVEDAARALDLSILITAATIDTVAQQVASEAEQLLTRTVRCTTVHTGSSDVAAELVIGAATPRTDAARVYVQISAGSAVIGRLEGGLIAPCADVPRILQLLIACYASTAALYHALRGRLPVNLLDPLVIDFRQLGIDLSVIARPLELGHAYLAGAGAIGNGFLWAARHLNLRGQLEVVDDDTVSSGNLNRQIWFHADDIGKPKSHRLVACAQSSMPDLHLIPRQARLQALPEREGSWLRTLIVAVDSRRARRALQNECPGEVFDASTTDIREIVVHHNAQPCATACLSCIYEPDGEEHSREQHLAGHLGVGIDAVRTERISPACARIIAARFPQLNAGALEGTAYDTLFKALCAEGALHTPENKRIVAPFACVSVMAGTLLALEVVRRRTAAAPLEDNYWRLSPWHAPMARRRILRPRQPDCAFCTHPVLRVVNESLWRR